MRRLCQFSLGKDDPQRLPPVRRELLVAIKPGEGTHLTVNL